MPFRGQYTAVVHKILRYIFLALQTAVCLSNYDFGPVGNISTAVGWIAIKVCTAVCDPQKMNNNFGQPLNLYLDYSSVQINLICPKFWFMSTFFQNG